MGKHYFYALGLGSNLGKREENLQNAVSAIARLPKTRIMQCANVYESEPVGCEIEQGNYLNSAILIASEFTPHEMLGICMGIECALGRERTAKNAPRIIDIDMLYAEDKVLKTKNLVVPHPEIENRLFVLAPLKDIFFKGNAFGFIFDQYIDKNRNQRLKLTNFKLTYPRYEGK